MAGIEQGYHFNTISLIFLCTARCFYFLVYQTALDLKLDMIELTAGLRVALSHVLRDG
jgi:hypothetical protein